MDARYRLAPMREVRAREERVQQGDLAGEVGEAKTLAAEVEAATRRVEEARAQIARAVRSRGLALTRGVTIGALAGADRHLDKLRHELDAAEGARARADARHAGQLDAVDAARARLGRARGQRELIERHFAAWRADRQKLAERRED
ncbi:MAG TPA: hypothetical protein VGC42_32445 [Kofleriaceae bacterium]